MQASRLPSWVSPLLGGLQTFIGVGALAGGLMLMLEPSGSGMGFPVELLQGSPFPDYRIPGVFLFTVNGLGSLVGAGLSFARHRHAGEAAALLGGILDGLDCDPGRHHRLSALAAHALLCARIRRTRVGPGRSPLPRPPGPATRVVRISRTDTWGATGTSWVGDAECPLRPACRKQACRSAAVCLEVPSTRCAPRGSLCASPHRPTAINPDNLRAPSGVLE